MDPFSFAILMALIGAAAYADFYAAGGRWPPRLRHPQTPCLRRSPQTITRWAPIGAAWTL